MTILAFPTLSLSAPSGMTFRLEHNTMAATSPLNKTVQTAELPGAMWHASLTWDLLEDGDARIMKAWLAQLRGRAGRFYLHDYTHPTPSGTAAGTPLVKGAGQSGASIITDGWTPNQTALLKAGDYISIGSQLLVVTATVSSDATGNATITFEPPLRSVPADNTPIVTTRPACVMMLKTDDQDNFAYIPPIQTSLQIECMEAF